LDRQRGVVAELEEQFSCLDEGVANLKRVKANLKRYKKSVLRDGAQGRLVREAHPSLEYTRIPDAGFDLPDGWTWTSVGDVGRLQLGRQRSPKYHAGPNMRPYLRVQNVFEDRIDLSDVMEMNFSDADFARFGLRAGDILLNEGQSPEFLGRPAMYRGELPGACFTNTLIRFQAHSSVVPEFVLIVFRHYMHSGRFSKESNITTNIAHLSLGRLAQVEFAVPPLPEQQRIVAEVDRRLSIVRELEAEVDANLKRAQALRQAVLTKVFTP
jgi:type I restriction enzyme S subunit